MEKVWLVDKQGSMAPEMWRTLLVVKTPAAIMKLLSSLSENGLPKVVARSQEIRPVLVQHWSNNVLHAILCWFLSNRVMMVLRWRLLFLVSCMMISMTLPWKALEILCRFITCLIGWLLKLYIWSVAWIIDSTLSAVDLSFLPARSSDHTRGRVVPIIGVALVLPVVWTGFPFTCTIMFATWCIVLLLPAFACVLILQRVSCIVCIAILVSLLLPLGNLVLNVKYLWNELAQIIDLLFFAQLLSPFLNVFESHLGFQVLQNDLPWHFTHWDFLASSLSN